MTRSPNGLSTLWPSLTQLGGDWSTHWYNSRIYESDITRGLIIWDLSDNVVAGAINLDHLNPQAQWWKVVSQFLGLS